MLNYSRVNNRNKKIRRFAGFGTGYTLFLSTIFSSIGSITQFATHENKAGFIWLGMAAGSATVLVFTVFRLSPKKYDLLTEWEIIQDS
ncbi:MAG: hypothetical protein HRT71_06350 [Flavobacteriales bacterium]|nr:hypothetical protein [Flavobacteriales bacterium]